MMLSSLLAYYVILIFLVLIVLFILIVMNSTRGIRNNNPFNIRYSKRNKWHGKYWPPMKQDKEFEEFSDMDLGIRAMIKLLQNYFRNGLNTPSAIIGVFAPFTENDTESYIKFVGNYINPYQKIVSVSQLYKLLQGMAMYESRYSLGYLHFKSVLQTHFNNHFNFKPL